ncbi:AhpC/TSA family protein [Chryseobacterium sp. SN22]|uniref:TlpA disulfide reductase family protein n=1 Tax=Chryseobacterium sp. SN22 TaxID=2606431 RepID=UPI0011ECDD38|nr:TlpA disulfide reductase family protein [Chryseobacterium sp. SN22]KAA0127287.1 AhpC/TSA family protein [Chryseobacterium sp. SN22]
MNVFHKFIIFFFLSFFYSYINSQNKIDQNEFVLDGTIDKVNTGYIVLSYSDFDNNIRQDSCKVINGKFLFKGKVKGAAISNLHYIPNSYFSFPDDITLFLEKNLMSINISKDFVLREVHGSNAQNDWTKINSSATYIKKESLWRIINEMDPENVDYERNRNRLDSINKEQIIYDYKFTINNPSSFISPYLLALRFERKEISIDSIETVFKKLTPAVKKSSFGEDLKDKIIMRKSSAVGQKAYDFERTDINGTLLKLSSFKDKKYVLLDFSASWCRPCKEQLPKLKQLFERYHKNDLEIIVVSWDLDEQSWKKGVLRDEINNWYNILDSLNPKNNGLKKIYSVSDIPTLILIDKEGIIIGRYDNNTSNFAVNNLESELENIFVSKKINR